MNLGTGVREYLEVAKGTGTPPPTLARDFLEWRRHRGGSALEEREPWITFAARRRLAQIVRPGMTVFEYGAGGSTLWFADRVARVISVEHDRTWYEAMRVPANVTLLLSEPQPAPDDREFRHYRSTDPQYRGLWFRDYARTIREFDPDLVLVDGRARVDCAIEAAHALRPGGWLVVDDTDRAEYAPIFAELRWPFTRYPGPKPYGDAFAETTIWRRPTERPTLP